MQNYTGPAWSPSLSDVRALVYTHTHTHTHTHTPHTHTDAQINYITRTGEADNFNGLQHVCRACTAQSRSFWFQEQGTHNYLIILDKIKCKIIAFQQKIAEMEESLPQWSACCSWIRLRTTETGQVRNGSICRSSTSVCDNAELIRFWWRCGSRSGY